VPVGVKCRTHRLVPCKFSAWQTGSTFAEHRSWPTLASTEGFGESKSRWFPVSTAKQG